MYKLLRGTLSNGAYYWHIINTESDLHFELDCDTSGYLEIRLFDTTVPYEDLPAKVQDRIRYALAFYTRVYVFFQSDKFWISHRKELPECCGNEYKYVYCGEYTYYDIGE